MQKIPLIAVALLCLFIGTAKSTQHSNSGAKKEKITAEQCLEKLHYTIEKFDTKDPNFTLTFIKALIVNNKSPCIVDNQIYVNTFNSLSINAELGREGEEDDEDSQDDEIDISYNIAVQCFAVVELIYERSHSLLQLVNKGNTFKENAFEITEILEFVEQFKSTCTQYIVKEDEVSEDQMGDL